MGLLVGSTILFLTIIWGTCVIVGKCDIEGPIAKDSQNTRGFSLTGSGVSTDIWTSYTARIMVISVIPFLIVQIPQVFKPTSGRPLAVLVALIVSLLLLGSYCLYQVFQPWIQRRRLAYVKHKHVISRILRHLGQRALGRLLTDDGKPDREMIKKLFSRIDENDDGQLSYGEVSDLVVGIEFDEIDLDHDDAVRKIVDEFDTNCNSLIDEDEFFNGISRWLSKAKRSGRPSTDAGLHTMTFLIDFHQETTREHDLLDVGGSTKEAVENAKWNCIKAVLLLLLGTVIAAAIADPLVDAVDEFSDVTSIPAFFVSFIALPFATKSSEAVSVIISASRDNSRLTASLTFSELYGAVTMNNACLAVFLALVYIRGLTWDFSAEVLVILVVCIVMGVFASFRTTFPLWTSIMAILLCPFSLALVYLLVYVFGWS
ncbi:hypothetical protein QN277_008800 [Acacia crassicarpa]|nr:hypothetical protein QN277_008800 [Acacia crassicarpa]